MHFQRQSNNYAPDFTDQEVLTIYLFAMFQKRISIKDIYQYTHNHWLAWFAHLPSYQAYNHRLDQLGWQFQVMVNELITTLPFQDAYPDVCLTHCLPIIVSKRTYQAKLAL